MNDHFRSYHDYSHSIDNNVEKLKKDIDFLNKKIDFLPGNDEEEKEAMKRDCCRKEDPYQGTEMSAEDNPFLDFIFRVLIEAFPETGGGSRVRNAILYFMDHKVPVPVIMEGIKIMIGTDEDDEGHYNESYKD